MTTQDERGTALPGCVPDCECAHVYGPQHVTQAPGGRLAVAAVALRPGDAYLVVRPGRNIEALITDLWIPQHNPCCRAGVRTIDGHREPFWIEAGYVIVTRRDPAYEGWAAEQRPAPQPPAPDDAFAFSPWVLCGRFSRWRDQSGDWRLCPGERCHVAGTAELPGGGRDWAVEHSESRHGGAGWDMPGDRGPWGPPRDKQDSHLMWVARAQTACMAEDLGRDDEIRPLAPGESFISRYTCRLGHVHYGERPGPGQLPPEVAARISASLGDGPARAQAQA